ncbi:MAG TPA: rhomboid family intramembrane serine protease, partial [Candidatus Krumholzibacterium sp.]|nr:rhomboid family intramembrane serine protease [Candidatus Krumholzibacterium sp.]
MYFFYYFPVGLDLKVRRTPVITLFLSVMCVITFIIYRYGPIGLRYGLGNLVFLPFHPLPATAFSHVFLHAGYMHLAGNLVYLVLFGRALEDRL